MNLAFPALFALLLALPGLIAVRAYFIGTKDSPTARTSLGDQLAWGIPISIGLHSIWVVAVGLAGSLGLPRVDLGLVLQLLANPAGVESGVAARVAAHPVAISAYFFSIWSAAALAGRSAHWLVRKGRFDLRYSFLRFDSPWFYLLSGEQLQFGEKKAFSMDFERETVETIAIVSAVVNRNEPVIYKGLLNEWYLDGDGQLDRLELLVPERRRFSWSGAEDSESVQVADRQEGIVATYMVLRYSEIEEFVVNFRWVPVPYEDVEETTAGENNNGSSAPVGS